MILDTLLILLEKPQQAPKLMLWIYVVKNTRIQAK